jgi:hypothetical protein
LAIGAMSCQKDIEQGSIASAVGQPKVDYFNSVTPKPSPNDDVVQRIDAFKSRIEPTSNFGAGDEMGVNEAIWGIEAVLNQRFSNASKRFISQQIDSASFTVPLTASGDISTNDVASALTSAKQALQEQWDRVREGSKHVIVTDVSLRNQNATTATFTVASAIGIEQMLRTVVPPPVPFGGGEGWMDGEKKGGCALNTGLGIGTADAASKIVDRWTDRWSSIPAMFYHTDIQTVRLNRDGPDGFLFDKFYTRKWVYSTSTTILANCISDLPGSDFLTLNDYLAGVPLFIDDLKPSGKSYITLSMTGDRETNAFNNGRCHRALILYGTAHLILTPREGEEPPCCM